MKLKTARIRSYRVHRDTSLQFEPGLTLVSGPNESGKSTLVEAIHRALFLRARTGGEPYDQMKSLHGDVPRIELELDLGGKACRVAKTFRGGRGDATLELAGSPALTGDEAEDRLAELLHSGTPVDGRGAASQLPLRWAHLWVWQGQSGRTPTGLVREADQHEALLRRLQAQGGAGVALSALDYAVAAMIRERKAVLYTDAGKPKANTDEARAASAVATLEAAWREASARVEELDGAARRLLAVREDLQSKAATLALTQAEYAAAGKDLERAEGLARDLEQLDRNLLEVTAELDRIRKMANDLETARNEARQKGEEASRADVTLKGLDTEAEACRTVLNEAEAALEAARAAHSRADAGFKALAEQALVLEKQRRLDELAASLKAIEQHRRKRDALLKERESVPAVEDGDLEALQELQQALGNAEATLAALGATLEVVAARQEVQIDGKPVEAGSRHVITADVKVTIGQGTTLTLRPGGATGIAEARDAVTRAREDLRERLVELGVKDVGAAARAKRDRDRLAAGIAREDEALERMDAEACEAELAETEGELAQARNRAAALAAAIELALPADMAALRQQRRAADAANEAAAEALRNATAKSEAARQRLERAVNKRDEAQRQQRALRADQQDAVTRARTLEEQFGSDAERRAQEEALLARRNDAQGRRNGLARELDALQPALCRQSVERLRRAVDMLQKQGSDLQQEQATLQERLRLHGTTDPRADLQELAARLEQARARHAELARQGQAILLLAKLVEEVQREVADRFTGPLVATVRHYLECVFGPGSDIRVSMDESQAGFDGLECVRDPARGGSFAFDQLSGGAREQVGVAFRLALAELLAAEHGGSLPVVLDDAFANSDPQRVRSLLAMLDLAARRGLQVIVLTCAPADYAGLGAREVRLEPPVAAPVAGPAAPVDEGGAEPAVPDPDEGPGAGDVTGDEAAFLEALTAMGGRAGNKTLRARLDWTEDRYDVVKHALIAKALLEAGRGRGGSVALR